MELNEAGVRQAVVAFYKNDPYYPRPQSGGRDQDLWESFKQAFLQTSHEVLSKTDHHLADLCKRGAILYDPSRMILCSFLQ